MNHLLKEYFIVKNRSTELDAIILRSISKATKEYGLKEPNPNDSTCGVKKFYLKILTQVYNDGSYIQELSKHLIEERTKDCQLLEQVFEVTANIVEVPRVGPCMIVTK